MMMEDAESSPAEWMPTRSSACLTEKLKTLLETPNTNTKQMDYNARN